MHPRNPYKDSIDFYSLADLFPLLKPYVSLSSSGKYSIDFKDPDAQRTLTQALLKRDFNLTLTLPDHRLCPPVPNRLNYILWIQDILSTFQNSASNQAIKGLDIGTGASAIYPLLACSLPNTREWTFVGTEIDSLSASYAHRNVEINNLQSRITIWPIQSPLDVTADSAILTPLTQDPESRFDFTMCNPPFYGSASEIKDSAKAKVLPPNAVCTGAETEMITPGGETAFVLQMLHESARRDVQGRCRWFTSMLGKLSSVGEIVSQLRKMNIDNYGLSQFTQGTTRRWAVAWSFGDERLSDLVARPSASSLSSYLPAPTTLRQIFFTPSQHMSAPTFQIVSSPYHEDLKPTLSRILESLRGISFYFSNEMTPGSVTNKRWSVNVVAYENTWSRSARRKRKRSISPSTENTRKTALPESDSAQPEITLLEKQLKKIQEVTPRPALQCCISARTPESQDNLQKNTGSCHMTLEAQWMRGCNRALFDSFWSHMCHRIRDSVEAGSTRDVTPR
ncbi:hypothetical protein K439DRAFT_1401880 [Ramaria rubella]|nr:hypothetical protein K439DRAFT_1401880 [Ramaria rubella]